MGHHRRGHISFECFFQSQFTARSQALPLPSQPFLTAYMSVGFRGFLGETDKENFASYCGVSAMRWARVSRGACSGSTGLWHHDP